METCLINACRYSSLVKAKGLGLGFPAKTSTIANSANLKVTTSQVPKFPDVNIVSTSFLLLVVRPGATSSVLLPSSDALCY